MIPFNSIFLHQFGQQFNDSLQFYNWRLSYKYSNFNSKDVAGRNVLIRNTRMIASTLGLSSFRDSHNSLFEEYKNSRFIERSFWQKLINNYLKETVFLSCSSIISNDYINKLKSLDLSIYKGNRYKNFIDKFNKDLLKGKIDVEASSLKSCIFSLPEQRDHLYLKYTWPKLLNLSSFLKKKDVTNIPYNLNILKFINSALPLFVIVNDNSELVLSESVNQIQKGGVLSNLHNYFTKSNQSSKNLYTGLLFINYNDALEYKSYIQSKYNNSTRKIRINIAPTHIGFYYKLFMLKNNTVDFRLIPDLKEVSNLTYKYKKHRNIKFNTKQHYGRNFFQGQPLYFIQPSPINKKFFETFVNSSNVYFYQTNNFNLKYQPVFLNYNTLISSWEKLRKENISHNIPSKPIVSIYNLESFIKDCDGQQSNSSIIFLPSYETYNVIKSYLHENFRYKKNLKFWIFSQSLHLKTLCMRVFWSLTSRQPIKW